MPIARKTVQAALLAAALLSGCASPSFEMQNESGFGRKLVSGGRFTLYSLIRTGEPGAPITIYIEGDGRAWLTRSRISADPTPVDSLVMKLASVDPSPNVAYLARPGQYTSKGASECGSEYWTSKRFSPEVIKGMDSAVTALKEAAAASSVSLVGYSGGGAVAVLVAARRDDVIALRTIAGNLDHEAVNKWNKVSPLKGSLNAIDCAEEVAGIPQRHFIASEDRIVPSYVAETFAEMAGDAAHESVTEVRSTTHYAGWEKKWSGLLDMKLYRPRDKR